MLRDLVLGALSVPLADKGVSRLLKEKSLSAKRQLLIDWLESVRTSRTRITFRVRDDREAGEEWLLLEVASTAATIGVRFIGEHEIRELDTLGTILNEVSAKSVDLAVLMVCADDSETSTVDAVNRLRSLAGQRSDTTIVMEPSWAAALDADDAEPTIG